MKMQEKNENARKKEKWKKRGKTNTRKKNNFPLI